MGCQTTPTSSVTTVEATNTREAAKLAAQAAESEVEQEQKAARKAAKKASKLAAAVETDAPDFDTKEAEEKAARKAARKAAKLAAATETAKHEEEDNAVLKVAKKTAKAAALGGVPLEESAAVPVLSEKQAGTKRKKEDADSDSTAASTADQKHRKTAEGDSVATKLLGTIEYRKAHQIVVGSGCPEPMETFDSATPSFGLNLTKALLAQKYTAPTPIQAQGWPVALTGQDMVAVAKTGSGKTCGFLLPALARIAERGPQQVRRGWNTPPATPTVLVLAPTRELVQQIAAEAEKFAKAAGARVVVLYGGVPKGDQVRELKQGADIVIATPGRLMDLAKGVPDRGIPSTITMENVSYFVLDEADRMLDMGFEPDIRKIAQQCKPSGRAEEGGGASGPLAGSKRQTLFFTATWPKAVQQVARSLTSNDALNVSIGQGTDGDKLSANPMVKQTVLMMSPSEKSARFHQIIKDELGPGQTCLVFAGQKRFCDVLENEIWRKGSEYGFKPWCGVIHSDKDQWIRDEALQQFRKLTAGGDERGILVATDVAARGLDIPGVAMVVVYDFGRSKNSDGSSVESYVHRIGRTGRAGKSGKAWTFFTKEDSGAAELVEVLDGAGQEVPPELRRLGDAEWYKNMERENKKNFYRNRGRKGSGKGCNGGGKGKGSGRGFGGHGSGGGY